MNAIVLVCVMMCASAEEDKLLARLDADFEALAAEDPNRQKLREAAKLLEETNQSDHWNNYIGAMKILRQTRSKAGIPLLLKYMIKHADYGAGSARPMIQEYADTLSLLTGKDIPTPYHYVRNHETPISENAQGLTEKWWTPKQGEITTDVDKMTPEQLEIVVDRLLKKVRPDSYLKEPSDKAEVTAYRLYHLVKYRIMQRHGSDRPEWSSEELCPGMVDPLLARAGFAKEPTEETREKRVPIPYAAILLLADLRKNGCAEELAQIADDARQNTATRLTCVLAICAADEELKTPVLLSILEKEKYLESRLVAIFALEYSKDRDKAGAKLVDLLDDRNSEVRTAAICALRGPRPGAALPKLKKVVDDFDAKQGVPFFLDTLGAYRTQDANSILVDFLRAGLEDQSRNRSLSSAIHALEEGTGRRWSKAGAQRDEVWRNQARAAVEWWDNGGKWQDPVEVRTGPFD